MNANGNINTTWTPETDIIFSARIRIETGIEVWSAIRLPVCPSILVGSDVQEAGTAIAQHLMLESICISSEQD